MYIMPANKAIGVDFEESEKISSNDQFLFSEEPDCKGGNFRYVKWGYFMTKARLMK